MTATNIRSIIKDIRHYFEINRCLGLYSWLSYFDQLLPVERFEDCLSMLLEMKKGGYCLSERELCAIDERECAFRLQRHGVQALIALYEEMLAKLKSEKKQENYYAETLFRMGLLYHHQGQLKKALDSLTSCKSIKENLEEIEGVGRVSRALTAVESKEEIAKNILSTLWNEYIEHGRNPIQVIKDFLNDKNWRVRHDAVFALGEIKAIDELSECLQNHPDFKVRRDALIILQKLPQEIAMRYLIIALADNEWLIRWYSANELGHIRGKQSEEALLKAISDADIDVRMTIIDALGKIAGENVCKNLEAIIQEPESYNTLGYSLRRKARNTITEINNRFSSKNN